MLANHINVYVSNDPWLPTPVATSSARPGLMYVTLKNTISPYEDLPSIEYQVIHNGYKTLEGSQEVFGGDSFIGDLQYFQINTSRLTGSNRRVSAVAAS